MVEKMPLPWANRKENLMETLNYKTPSLSLSVIMEASSDV